MVLVGFIIGPAIRSRVEYESSLVDGPVGTLIYVDTFAQDGELEPGIVDDAREAGVELLPSRNDLKPHCSCPDDAVPCKHAAAVLRLLR